IVFTVIVLSSCSKEIVVGETDGNTASTTFSENESITEENDKNDSESADTSKNEDSELVGTSKNEESPSKKSDEPDLTESTASEVTTENVKNFESDSSASITVKDTVVNRCLKIESVGESDGVLCVAVTNVSDSDLEYCVLKCKTGDDEAVFSFSVLPKGESAVAGEQNNLKYEKDMEFSSWSIENSIYYEQGFSLNKDTFDIKCEGDYIEIKNKTQDDIDGKIKICYKNLQNEKLYSNNAYLVSVDGLKKGETKQLFPKYLDSENSRVIYIEYDK
ncbi:MAG: hypothetical protein ACI4SB_03230, partial [Acutalibacteraceae bacterium]